MRYTHTLLLISFFLLLLQIAGLTFYVTAQIHAQDSLHSEKDNESSVLPTSTNNPLLTTPVGYPIPAAENWKSYANLLTNKRIALVVNQTSMVGKIHLTDFLLQQNIRVVKVFAPEHGFRGDADAGATIKNSRDVNTGLPVISLYGKNKKPLPDDLKDVDLVVFDIQDVGARFYTYISTMHYVMEACAEQNKEFVVLDRPNPNGFYIDGPILEPAYQSFVGMHPIPIVHGLTVGELALMINGEGWLANGERCNLTVVPCQNYTHQSFYELPIKPSPNLPNPRAIYLYPSLCFFEGAAVSVGRGTDKQFQLVGSPKSLAYSFAFTPVSKPGAASPVFMNETCYGIDLSDFPIDSLRSMRRINLQWLINFYQTYSVKDQFFNAFFNKLAGNDVLQQQIKDGLTEEDIRATWQWGLDQYKAKRRQYLLYPDFK
ncbi:MAG TPA: DUF1343 domain-containing protein [Chitinophagales bacterium]|nr:DUF1343 domain-containing protein [Chitinophagales bacterium]